jgi:hypothetical protein
MPVCTSVIEPVARGMVVTCLALATAGLSVARSLAAPPASPPCTIHAAPVAGPAGTEVHVRGTCDGILYHRMVSLSFDGRVVGTFDGVGADYTTGFTVPEDAAPGPHVIELVAPFARASLRFGVTAVPIFCAGDCDGSGTVQVNELVLGVGVALDDQPESDCPLLDTDGGGSVTVDELVGAVHNALVGCGRCHGLGECPPGQRCVEPGGSIGCGSCQVLPDECMHDADCGDRGERSICASPRPQDCACDSEVHICQPGCGGAEDCGPNEECDATFRCMPRQCSRDDCGPLFSCLPAEAGDSSCVRTPCGGDSICTRGVCVNNHCYNDLGLCLRPPPWARSVLQRSVR